MSPASTPDPLLSVRDLTVAFPGRDGPARAVRGVSFDIGAGETLALLGESGSGKSVTARAVMGLLPRGTKVGGSIRFAGTELAGAPRRRVRALCGTEMAMVFQDPLSSLNPVFPVREQIAELFRVRGGMGRAAARDAAVEAMAEVGIPDARRRATDYPHQFSGGMRQRIMIAMAIALRPRLLIADEPTTALDVTVQAQIMELMSGLQREHGVALLLITHDLGVVAQAARRTALMYAGRLVETGPLREVYDTPAHPYTRGLLRSVPDALTPPGGLHPIAGQPPSPLAPPSGCSFHPRCERATDRCAAERPEPRPVGGTDRLSACHYAEEVVHDELPIA